MNIHNLKKRLRQNRPTSVVQVRMPDDVVEDLQRIAPKLGIPNYQALICHYVGKGLREDILDKTISCDECRNENKG